MTMLEQLKKIAQNSYAPYSNFNVATVFLLNSGEHHCGFNIENAAYPSSMCAERVCLFSMIANNIDPKQIKSISIYSPRSNDFLAPCGECRQVLSEHISENVIFYLYRNDGAYIAKKFSELMPYPIKKELIKGK